MKNNLLRSAAIVGTLTIAGVFSVAPAHAANFTVGTCNNTDVTAGGFNATSCKNFAGNDDGFETTINSAFGFSTGTWSLLGKSDKNNDPVTNINTNPDIFSGDWNLISPTQVSSPFVVTVKAGDFFAAYLFEGLKDITSGTFNVFGVTQGKNSNQRAGLSHLSVYTSSGVKPPKPVPTPALLPGLIAMGAGVLRKRKAEQTAEAKAEV